MEQSENQEMSTETQVTESKEINFLDNLSEELRIEPSLKDFKDVNGLAKSYVNAQKMIGKSIRLPSEDSSPEAKQDFLDKLKGIDDIVVKPKSEEELGDFYNKLGRPESKDGYKLQDLIDEEISASAPDLIPEIEKFSEEAYNLGLTDKQAKALLGNRITELKHNIENQNVQKEESLKTLQKMWGQDYDNRLAAAKQTAKIYAEKYPNEMENLINSTAGNNPAFLNMLVELGSTFKEKGHVGMQQTKFGMTPDNASEKIKEKRSDRGFMQAYTDDRHPGHKKAVEELMSLYEIANG